MKPEDRACFNCEGCSDTIRMPNVGATSGADYMGFCECRQRLSDHYRHILSLLHVCAWHSDSVKDDKRYPNWKASIDKEGETE